MKIFIMAALLLAMASPKRCAEENEEGWETEAQEAGYEVNDADARAAVANWNKFLVQSDAVVTAASIKISQATDRLEDLQHKRKLKLAIIAANGRMEKLSDMLLTAKKIQPQNYTFDEPTLQKIELFKKEFKNEQAKLNEALKELED